MSNRPRLRGVIFDLDDTLVHSQLDYAMMRREIGVPENEGILEFIERLPSEFYRDRANAIVQEHELAGAKRATPIKGVPELLEAIKGFELELGLFTRNDKIPTSLTLERLFQNQFSAVVTRDDAPAKPHPAGLRQICEKWSCSTSEVVYIGDYLYDLQAAKNAEMKSILYLSDGSLPDYAADAHYVTRDLADLAKIFEDVMSQSLGFAL